MAFDYQPIIDTATELLTEFGRSIVVQRLDQTASDAARPWRGPADTTAGFAATVDTVAAAVPPSSAKQLGLSSVPADQLARIEQILIVAPTAVSLTEFDQVADGGESWEIEFVEELKPADDTLLSFVGVRR